MAPLKSVWICRAGIRRTSLLNLASEEQKQEQQDGEGGERRKEKEENIFGKEKQKRHLLTEEGWKNELGFKKSRLKVLRLGGIGSIDIRPSYV